MPAAQLYKTSRDRRSIIVRETENSAGAAIHLSDRQSARYVMALLLKLEIQGATIRRLQTEIALRIGGHKGGVMTAKRAQNRKDAALNWDKS